MSASDPGTEHWIKRNRTNGIIFFAVIAAIVGVLAFNYITIVIPEKERESIFRLAREGTPEEIREAAQAGANFSITASDVYVDAHLSNGPLGITTLFVAVIFNTPEAVKAITETGVDINVAGRSDGFTALMNASAIGKYDTVKVLIDAGADVNHQDRDGWTALMCATRNNEPEIVKLLLKHGADKNIRDI